MGGGGSGSGNLQMQLPPGFRFHPTDVELANHYLCRKCSGLQMAAPIIAEIDLYKFDPWDLPGVALYGEKEWYFFSPRDRKYPNGSRPNRAAGSGYWKATGADKPIGLPKPVAIKKALVFYSGKAPRGEKTNWIMHEYRLADVDRSARRKNRSLRLDDWVLCRIYNKKGAGLLNKPVKQTGVKTRLSRTGPVQVWSSNMVVDQKPQILKHMPQPSVNLQDLPVSDLFTSDRSESLPQLHTDSSCSEHVLSPEFSTCETGESHSRRRPTAVTEWEKALVEVRGNNGNATFNGFPPLSPTVNGFGEPVTGHTHVFTEAVLSMHAYTHVAKFATPTTQESCWWVENFNRWI